MLISQTSKSRSREKIAKKMEENHENTVLNTRKRPAQDGPNGPEHKRRIIDINQIVQKLVDDLKKSKEGKSGFKN